MWQWYNQIPGMSGTISAVTIWAANTDTTSVRWPPTTTVLPCQWGVCALLKSPSDATYQRTRSPTLMVIIGMFPKMYPFMDHLTFVAPKPVTGIETTNPSGVACEKSVRFTPFGSVV